MADLTSTRFRQYDNAGTAKWRATPIEPNKIKSGYAELELEHPDHALNQEYINAGAADDRERPLCWAIHNGIPCRRPVTWMEGARYCWQGRGDE